MTPFMPIALLRNLAPGLVFIFIYIFQCVRELQVLHYDHIINC